MTNMRIIVPESRQVGLQIACPKCGKRHWKESVYRKHYIEEHT